MGRFPDIQFVLSFQHRPREIVKESSMDTTNMLRVNAHPGSYGGLGNSPQDRQQQRRQKMLAVFDAVENGNLEASKLAFKSLMNFDRTFLADSQFTRLSKALDAGSIYLAQQVVREIKTKLINAAPIGSRPSHNDHPPRFHHTDGLHLIDTQA